MYTTGLEDLNWPILNIKSFPNMSQALTEKRIKPLINNRTVCSLFEKLMQF